MLLPSCGAGPGGRGGADKKKAQAAELLGLFAFGGDCESREANKLAYCSLFCAFYRPTHRPIKIWHLSGLREAAPGVSGIGKSRRMTQHHFPTNPDTKKAQISARGTAPALALGEVGTTDKIDTSSGRARRGLDCAPGGKVGLGVAGGPGGRLPWGLGRAMRAAVGPLGSATGRVQGVKKPALGGLLWGWVGVGAMRWQRGHLPAGRV